jgi:phage terminase large subunit-like protein
VALAVVPTAVPRRAPAKAPALPFTLPHFRAWAADLILDTGDSFHPEAFFEAFVEDVFAGYRECWLVVPEGNTKTTSFAGLALYHCEFQPYANVPVAASSREQAEILYRQAEGFVLRSPRLRGEVSSPIQAAKGKRKLEVPRFTCLEGYRRINHFEGGRIQVLAADDRTGDGGIPTLALLDELHRHRDLALYRTWTGKLEKRGGQIGIISTAGEPGSEFEQTRDRIRQLSTEVVRRGSFVRASSPRLVLHEWAVPEKADPHDFDIVKSANPFSRITTQSLREKYESPTMTEAHWSRFVCNRPTRSVTAAITEAEWTKAKRPDAIPPSVPIWYGLDVAWQWDTTSGVPFWMPDRDHRYFGEADVLVPPRDGTMLAPGLIKDAMRLRHKRNPITTVVMDMSWARDIADWISSELGATVVDRSQSTTVAVREYESFMEGLRTGVLFHAGDAGLTAHAMNAVARTLPLGDTQFDRPVHGRDSADQDRRVIDALKAAAMVHDEAIHAPEPEPAKPAPFVMFG